MSGHTDNLWLSSSATCSKHALDLASQTRLKLCFALLWLQLLLVGLRAEGEGEREREGAAAGRKAKHTLRETTFFSSSSSFPFSLVVSFIPFSQSSSHQQWQSRQPAASRSSPPSLPLLPTTLPRPQCRYNSSEYRACHQRRPIASYSKDIQLHSLSSKKLPCTETMESAVVAAAISAVSEGSGHDGGFVVVVVVVMEALESGDEEGGKKKKRSCMQSLLKLRKREKKKARSLKL